jgi:hypothetical protein
VNVRKKLRRQKKKFKTKKLKIGVKLQKNLDKNKFGYTKNCAYKNLNPAKKKYIRFVVKKSVDGRGEGGSGRNTTIPIHHIITHTINTTRQKRMPSTLCYSHT